MSDPATHRLVIIGSGPAGWTAAIYAARANLAPVVFTGVPRTNPAPGLPGGQLMLTTEVENYPGFPEGVTGPDMMQAFKEQALRFETRVVMENVEKVSLGDRPFLVEPSRSDYSHQGSLATMSSRRAWQCSPSTWSEGSLSAGSERSRPACSRPELSPTVQSSWIPIDS